MLVQREWHTNRGDSFITRHTARLTSPSRSDKSSVFIRRVPLAEWRRLSVYYLAIVGWLSSWSPAGGRQMFRGDPIRRPLKRCATINHQTICHPPSARLLGWRTKTQPFSLFVIRLKWAYAFAAGVIIFHLARWGCSGGWIGCIV